MSLWDANRAKTKGAVGELPRCSRCGRPSVLRVCHDCHDCHFTIEAGLGNARDGRRQRIRECPECGMKAAVDEWVTTDKATEDVELEALR